MIAGSNGADLPKVRGDLMAASRRKTKQVEEKPLPRALVPHPDYGQQFVTSYSNVAVVAHSQHEFCIDFCQAAPPMRVDLETEKAFVPVVARILIPPTLVEGFINALRVQLSKYKDDLAQMPANAAGAVEAGISQKE